jgi:hypothetical protein
MKTTAEELLYLADQQDFMRSRYNEDDSGLIRESLVIEWALRRAASAWCDAGSTGCICQDQHRRGYCTEPGCPFALAAPPSSSDAETGELAEWKQAASVEAGLRREFLGIATDLAECIGRYMSETDYRSRLLPAAAEFVANRGAHPSLPVMAMRDALEPFLAVAKVMDFYIESAMPEMTYPRPEYESKYPGEPRCVSLTPADFARLARALSTQATKP